MDSKESAEKRGDGIDGTPVACGKCGAPNLGSSRICSACGSHLHIVCKQCGARNLRSDPVCSNCRKGLHRGLWDRSVSQIRKQKDRHTARFTLVAVCVITILVVVWMVVKLAAGGGDLREKESSSASAGFFV